MSASKAHYKDSLSYYIERTFHSVKNMGETQEMFFFHHMSHHYTKLHVSMEWEILSILPEKLAAFPGVGKVPQCVNVCVSVDAGEYQ